MKTKSSSYRVLDLCLIMLCCVSNSVRAADVVKINNADNLNLTTSWVGGSVPGAGDVAVWTNVVTAANTVLLGADLEFAGIKVVNPGGKVTISAGNILTIGASGIDMTSANNNMDIVAPVCLSAVQVWDVKTGRVLDSNGNSNNGGISVTNQGNTLTVQGGGMVDLIVLSGSGGIIKNGSGRLALQSLGTYDYTGNVLLNAGTLLVGNNATALGSGASALTIAGGTLTFKSNFDLNFGRNVTVTGDFEIYNNNSGGNGAMKYTFGTLNMGSNTMTVTANGANDGTIAFGATTITGNPVFAVSNRINNVLVLGAVGESGGSYGITKTMEGTLLLTGSNTYSGLTIVSNGVLKLTNSVNAVLNPATTLNVASNGTFVDGYIAGRNLTFAGMKGAGTFAAGKTNSSFVVMNTLAPGDDGIGTMTVSTGCLQVAVGATYFLQLGGTTENPTNDIVSLTGPESTVSFTGAWTLSITNAGTLDPTGKTFILFDYAGVNPGGVGTPAIVFAEGTGWTGGLVSVDEGGTRIIFSGVQLAGRGTMYLFH